MQTDPNKEMMDKMHDDPANWVWGVFYFNKKDKRIFPPKRLSMLGWTINFANPYSLLAFAGLFILIAIILNFYRGM
ncbi:MAG TPA: DUF5808 domain-containing protein [Bacteroidia bacterium]